MALNIVGLAIDDIDLEGQFRNWVKLGGGRYFSAHDQGGLSQSFAEALQTPFSVYDQTGSLVAEGLVDGDPIEIEAGFYRVTVASSPARVFDRVEVPGEETVILELNLGDG